MNPIAIIFWIICGLIGYLINPSFYGFVAGTVPAMVVSFVISLND